MRNQCQEKLMVWQHFTHRTCLIRKHSSYWDQDLLRTSTFEKLKTHAATTARCKYQMCTSIVKINCYCTHRSKFSGGWHWKHFITTVNWLALCGYSWCSHWWYFNIIRCYKISQLFNFNSIISCNLENENVSKPYCIGKGTPCNVTHALIFKCLEKFHQFQKILHEWSHKATIIWDDDDSKNK